MSSTSAAHIVPAKERPMREAVEAKAAGVLERRKSAPIPRHRTAIRRYAVSRPIALGLADGLINRQSTVFDYGCGHGGDVRFLRARGIKTGGWDPHYWPNTELREADVVNLGYVINVIEDPRERAEALRQAYRLARLLLIVAVRVDRELEAVECFCDGFLTGLGTFQRIYVQAEFKEYLRSTLGILPLMAAPGIAYVFKTDDAKVRYLANRAFSGRPEHQLELIEKFSRDPIAKRYVRLAVKLGRVPLPEEFPEHERLQQAFGSRERVERLLWRHVDQGAFEVSRAERRADILTYVAMLRLEGLQPPPFGLLPAAVRGDLRAFWGSYGTAVREGERFLFSMGEPSAVAAAAGAARVGKLLPQDVYIHRSSEHQLPTLLRVIQFAASRIVGLFDYDLVKISIDGLAVSFLA